MFSVVMKMAVMKAVVMEVVVVSVADADSGFGWLVKRRLRVDLSCSVRWCPEHFW